MLRIIIVLPLILWLSGCSSLTTLKGNVAYQGKDLKKTYYQVSIKSFDETTIAATVFQPRISSLENAPLIIHAHGIGVFRISSHFSLYPLAVLSGESAMKAWKDGYWVISYDSRGHGGSDGKVSMMNPETEVRDVSAIIDWAVENIPNLKRDENDYSIGMIGESYGGGVQLLASVFEPRIDAIVPITTWYDLNMAMDQEMPKSLWGMGLYAATQIGTGFDVDSDLSDFFQHGMTNELTEADALMLSKRSLAHYCDTDMLPNSDALLIQGFTDTMLSVDHALKSRDCFLKAGKDVRTLLMRNGHHMPLVESVSRQPFFSNDKYINCDKTPKKSVDVVLNWWDLKLRGKSELDETVPEFCVSISDNEGIDPTEGKQKIETYDVAKSSVSSGFSGMNEWLFQPIDAVSDLLRWGEDHDSLEEEKKGGFFRPLFIPLKKAQFAQYVYGAPKIHANLKSVRGNPLVFVGLGLKRKSKSLVSLVDYQIQAVSGEGEHSINLPTVTAKLLEGDTIGLLVYGSHPHYMFRTSFLPNETFIAGKLEIPFVEFQ